MNGMVEVTYEERERRTQADAQRLRDERHAQRGFSVPVVDALGNVRHKTLAELEADHAEQEQFDREVQAAQRAQDQLDLAAAKERDRVAEQEAEQNAATFKARKLADWLAGGYGTRAQFEREWPELRRALFAQQQQVGQEDPLDRKRREMASGWSMP